MSGVTCGTDRRHRPEPEGTAIALETPPRSSRRRAVLVLSAVALAALVGVAWWALTGDTPREVDIDRALDQDPDNGILPTDDPEPDPDGEDEPGVDEPEPELPDPADQRIELTGTWTIDESREFDRAAGSGSFVGYRIDEELSGIGANTAVGRTPEVEATVVIDEMTVLLGEVEALLDGLESDDSRRDNRVRGSLGPGATARFELGERIELPEIPPVGEAVELETTGTLTILDVSREVTVMVQAAVLADSLVIAGSTPILLSDFEIEPPSAPIVLSVSDEATLEWQLFLSR